MSRSSANSRVLVYTDGGEGASPNCVAMVTDSLRRTLPPTIAVEATTSEEVIAGHWMQDCKLFVMPGGRDVPYVKELAGRGNDNIWQFVSNGGAYLGMCAGGYYGCSYVEFAKGDPNMEVVGPRELKFFPGIGQGPEYPGFDYRNNSGARAVAIAMEHPLPAAADPITSLTVFYNGGGTFVPFDGTESGYKVLASYTGNKEVNPCIVLCECGTGRAILSGVHFEASAQMLRKCYPEDKYIATLLPEIEKFEQQRETLFSYIVKLLVQ